MSANADKTLSMAGLQFIKDAEEEGGKPKLVAYNDGTGTWTIGWGCTEGVVKGMRITVPQAEEMLERELDRHIASVHRLIKVPVSQGLFDALVSFFFNVGSGKCQTLINAINSGGSDDQIRKAFLLYTKAYDEKLGIKTTWPGLVRRRTIEIAHWAKMDEMDPKVPTPAPPARVPAPAEPKKPGVVKTAVRSKSFLMQLQAMITLVVATLTDWAKQAGDAIAHWFGAAPDIKAEVKEVATMGQEFAGFLQLNVSKVVVPLVVVAIGVAMWRSLERKRELGQQ